MTVVACRDGVMAADGGTTHGDIVVGFAKKKIKRLADGSLCAAAGPVPLINKFHQWAALGFDAAAKPLPAKDEQFGAILLKADRTIWLISYDFELYEAVGEYACEGMATSFMMGAMAAGVSAEEAVRLAIRFHYGASGEIQIERLSDGR